jgi:site-specific DNA-methyltransferase (adenine-specific)
LIYEDITVNLAGCPVAELDAQSGNRPSTLTGRADPHATHENPGDNHGASWFGGGNSKVYADSGGASRFYPQFEGQKQQVEVPFFYTSKAAKKETSLDGEIENDHPTRKPLKLMRYLVKLVTRKGGLVLDPYCGSGSTLHATVEEGMRYTGIEKDPHAHEIATKRMEIVDERTRDLQGQRNLFDLMMNGYADE